MTWMPMQPSDIDEIKAIHARYFAKQFEFPDFYKFFCAMTIRDDNGEIITAGGVRHIAELVLITDKNMPVRKRRDALYRALDIARVTSRNQDLDQLHAFIQDTSWFRQLEKRGFTVCKGAALVTGA